MATKIKGTVSRIIPDQRNFFVRPDDEVALRYLDVDGHRVGDGELSSSVLTTGKAKFRPWTAKLPKLGDPVELELIRDPE